MIHVEVDGQFAENVDHLQLSNAAKTALEHEGAPVDSDLTLVVTGDEHLHRLNQQFLEIDAPTDVLGFPGGDVDPDTGMPYLGDVIISYPRAREQATQAGHSLQAELSLLVVHGVLHLLGHDHFELSVKDRMWAHQSEILSALGISINMPSD
jgi:probable rRNA maturation factor